MFFATKIDTGQRVAIKKLQIMRKGKNRLFVILNEVNVLAQSQHPNIIQYVGTYECGEELWVRTRYKIRDPDPHAMKIYRLLANANICVM